MQRIEKPSPTTLLVQRVLNGLFRPAATETSERGRKRTGGLYGMGSYPWDVAVDATRRERFNDINDMDADDGIIGSCLDVIADYATTRGDHSGAAFRFEPAAAPGTDTTLLMRAIDICERMVERTGINDPVRCWDETRAMVKYGDWFWEAIFAADGEELSPMQWFAAGSARPGQLRVERVKPFPKPYLIVRNEDDKGRQLSGVPGEAKPGECAWEQYDEGGNLIAQWAPYEIIHLWFGRREGGPYACPVLDSLRRHWRRLRMKEDGLAVARITRAYTQTVHKVLVPIGSSPTEIEEAIAAHKQAMTEETQVGADASARIATGLQKTPVDVPTDFYVACYYTSDGKILSGDIEQLPGTNPHIADLTDIEWDISRILARLRVPMKYLNLHLESATPFVDSDQESVDQAFGRLILNVQHAYRRGVWQLCVLELLLNGINPMEVANQIRIVMPQVSLMGSHLEARILNLRAQTAIMWDDLHIPADMIGSDVLAMTQREVEAWKLARAEARAQAEADAEGVENDRSDRRERIRQTYIQPERSQDPPRTSEQPAR